MIVLGTKRFADGIPAAAAAAISQMSSTVARLGGRLYWSPSAAIGPSTFVNSDGSGGATPISGLVGLELDQSNGWGFASPERITVQPAVSIAAWTASGGASYVGSGGGSFTINSGIAGSGYFIDLPAVPNTPQLISYEYTAKTGAGAVGVFVYDGAGFSPQIASEAVAAPGIRTFIVTPATSIVRIYLFTGGPSASGTFGFVGCRQLASPLANALTQPTTGNKPLLVPHTAWANALSFDGNDLLSTAPLAPTAAECFISAFRPVDFSTFRDVAGRGAYTAIAGNTICRYNAAAGIEMSMHDGTTLRTLSTGPLLSSTANNVVTWIKGVAGMAIREGGIQRASNAFAGVASAAPMTVEVGRASAFHIGTIAAQIWVPTEPSAADIAVMERGLGFIAGTVTA